MNILNGKIEYNLICLLFIIMLLKEGTIYIIRSKYNTKRTFTGTFKGCKKDNYSNRMNAEFTNLSVYYMRGKIASLTFYNYMDYNYYDVCKINNAKKARYNMEKRALDMILKRVVNEEFQW